MSKGKQNQNIKTVTATEQESRLITEQEHTINDNHVLDKPDVVPDNPDTVPEAEAVPDVFRCPECGKSFSNSVSLEHHRLRVHRVPKQIKAGEGRGRPSTPTREAKTYTPSEPILEEVSPEALPDELEYLDEKILKAHGIREREVVIRALKLRDPEDLVELQRALEDLGISRSRQRRIIRDYARYLGVKIPKILVEKLKPPNEYVEPPEWSGYGRRPIYEDGKPEKERKQTKEKSLLSLLIEWERLKKESSSNNSPSFNDNRLSRLEEKVERLVEKLEESEKRREEIERKLAEERTKHLEERFELKLKLLETKQNAIQNEWSFRNKQWDRLWKTLWALGKPPRYREEEYERETVEPSGRYEKPELGWVVEE